MLRLLALFALVAALAAVTVSTAAARAEKLTPTENRWAAPEVNLMKSLSGRVGAIRFLVDDPKVLEKGSAARTKLQATLREIVLCGQRLKRNGPPPTARLKPFHTALTSACSYYSTGAVQLIAGIAKLDTTLITKSGTTLRNGSKLLAVAQSRLVKLSA